MDAEDEIKQKQKALRERFEQHILDNFDGQEVWFQQKRVQLVGEAKILAVSNGWKPAGWGGSFLETG